MTSGARRNLWFGLAAIAVVSAACYVAFGGPLPFGGGHRVEAVVPSANALRPGSPVRVAGVQVGKVTGIRSGPGTAATIEMELADAGLPVHRDARLEIRPRLFLEGNFFVDLSPGTPAAGELGDGGVLPLGQTVLPVQMDQVLRALKAETRDELRAVLDELARALDGAGPAALRRTFAEAEEALQGGAAVARDLRGRREDDLRSLLADADVLSAALAGRRRELAALVGHFRRTADALGDGRRELRASLRRLAALIEEAPPALAAVEAAMPSVREFAVAAEPLLRRAPATLDLLEPVLVEATALLRPGELPALVAGLRPALRSLADLRPRLVALLDLVTPVAACVRDNALPTLTRSVDDDHLTTGRPVWQELLDGMVGLASASQDFDGNGPAVRYHAGGGEQLVSTGRLPDGSQLYGLTETPLVGSRPRRPAVPPPLRPDAPCSQQRPPDLRAAAHPAPPAQEGRAVRLTEGVLDGLRDLVGEARR